jgi:two-component system phosphate regulon sensor histidine kinase PhoR
MLSKLDESHRERNLESFGAMEPVDLMAVVHDASARMAGRADAAEVSLVVEGEPVLVEGYPRIVDELVSNLMSNAIRYNKPGGEVRVHVGLVEGRPTLEVADTGIGIPEEAQAKVFERFYRVETSRSRASGGTGLGLAIVKHGAMLHGADVSLQSVVGVGTTVTVSFPESQ